MCPQGSETLESILKKQPEAGKLQLKAAMRKCVTMYAMFNHRSTIKPRFLRLRTRTLIFINMGKGRKCIWLQKVCLRAFWFPPYSLTANMAGLSSDCRCNFACPCNLHRCNSTSLASQTPTWKLFLIIFNAQASKKPPKMNFKMRSKSNKNL